MIGRGLRVSRRSALLVAFAALGCMGKPKDPVFPPDDNFDLGAGKLFVTYRTDDAVAIVDPTTLHVDRTIPVGADPVAPDEPHEAIVAPDGESWFVTIQQGPRVDWGEGGEVASPDSGCPDTNPHCAHQGGAVPGGVERYRVRDNAFLGRAKVGFGAAQLVVTPDGTRTFVTAFDSSRTKCGRVAEINTATMTLVRLWGALDDQKTDDLDMRMPRAPHGIAITPDGSKVVIAAYWDRVVVIDRGTGQVTKIPIGTTPTPVGECESGLPVYTPNTVAVAADGKLAYVTLAGGALVPSSVVAVDLEALAMVPDFQVRTGKSPQQVVITPDGTRLLVACDGSRSLDIIDLATRAVTSVSLGTGSAQIRNPFGVTVSPDGHFAWIAAACHEFVGERCANLRRGALVEVDLQASPPAYTRKVPLGAGVTHATFGRAPR